MPEQLFTVTRFCCLDAFCLNCHKRGATGRKDKRARVVQADNLTREMAERYMLGWREYEPELKAQ